MRRAPNRSTAPMAEPRTFDLVVIAASAGGIPAVSRVLAALPAEFPVPIALVLHSTTRPNDLRAVVLQRTTALRVRAVQADELLQPGSVYVAPADRHVVVGADRRIALRDGHPIRFVLSSANPLLESAVEALGGRVIAVVLTGGGRDGTDGVQAVRAAGGVVIAQDRGTSQIFGMPKSAIATGAVSAVLPLEEIAPHLCRLVGATPLTPASARAQDGG
jgi:two-component system, chemotaxis family, protein-glutamate methylesterase/glutaminase